MAALFFASFQCRKNRNLFRVQLLSYLFYTGHLLLLGLDIGKAIVVIVMVVQIAGSSGSYPIEILPVVFGKIYKYFPFPYAINAMREGLCGTYGNAFFGYIAELLIFAVVALVIGLFVRKPFIAMNEFVAEKIEETEVL